MVIKYILYIYKIQYIVVSVSFFVYQVVRIIKPRQMLPRKQTFYQYIETNLSSSGLLSSEQISGIINMYSGRYPTLSKSERQKYYRVRKTYIVKHLLNTRYLYRNESPTPLRVVTKEELFDLFEKIHTEGGKHLRSDPLFVELKK